MLSLSCFKRRYHNIEKTGSRARLLVGLCGKNAFPYPTDLGQGYKFSTEGLWIPRIELAGFRPTEGFILNDAMTNFSRSTMISFIVIARMPETAHRPLD
jgi:hypothetical protein